jgi:hypothetical protein
VHAFRADHPDDGARDAEEGDPDAADAVFVVDRARDRGKVGVQRDGDEGEQQRGGDQSLNLGSAPS